MIKQMSSITIERRDLSRIFYLLMDSVRLEIISKENISHDKLTQEHLGFIHLAFSVGSKKG